MRRENRTGFDLAKLAAEIARQSGEPPPNRPARPSRRRPSLFGGVEEWTETYAKVAAGALAEIGGDSMVGELMTTWLAGLASGDPSRMVRPLVRGPAQPGGVRVAVLDALTDRDELIEALIGRPVPRTPRYRRDLRPPLAISPGTGRGLDAVYARAASASPAIRAALARREIEEQVSDPGARRVLARIVDRKPEAFDALPIGALARAAATAGPLWAIRVALDIDFVVTINTGALGVVGFAWWVPSDPSLRRFRRPLAAHLRYVFDRKIAPWGRWEDPRSRDEARRLILEKSEGTTMREFAVGLRARDPTWYGDEDLGATTRRLYRMSAALRVERRAFASVPGLRRQG